MPSYFDAVIDDLLAHEGGYIHDPDDAGGETKYGISRRTYPDLDIHTLTLNDAIAIYRRDFWRPEYDQLPGKRVAGYVFDMAVNMGHRRAHEILQRALGGVTADGVIGPQTLQAARHADPDALLMAMRRERVSFYVDLVGRKASQFKFLKGWLRRALA